MAKANPPRGVFPDPILRGGPNFHWPLVLTQKGGQTIMFPLFFLW